MKFAPRHLGLKLVSAPDVITSLSMTSDTLLFASNHLPPLSPPFRLSPPSHLPPHSFATLFLPVSLFPPSHLILFFLTVSFSPVLSPFIFLAVYGINNHSFQAACCEDGTVRVYEATDIVNLASWSQQVCDSERCFEFAVSVVSFGCIGSLVYF